MSVPAALTFGVGIGVLVVAPLLGIGCVVLADALHTWHLARQ